jgi:uncharacterized protein YbjT (DUF2867 family)
MATIVLTGTTGGLGSHVLTHLLKLVPATSLIISLSPSSKSPPASISSSGAHIRRGDLNDLSSLTSAFSGASGLFLVSYPGIAHAERVRAHRNAIDAAKAAGLRRVWYTSLAFAGDSKAEVMQAHLETEAYLKRSGLTYTIIREGIYSESWPLYFGVCIIYNERFMDYA